MSSLYVEQPAYINFPSKYKERDSLDYCMGYSCSSRGDSYFPPIPMAASHGSLSSSSQSEPSSSQPISCPSMPFELQEEILAHEQEKTYYTSRTWSMYQMIMLARRNDSSQQVHMLTTESPKPGNQCSRHDTRRESPSIAEDEEIFHLEI